MRYINTVLLSEVESRTQGQGHKKIPKPRTRTALLRTDPLEAKDKNAQGPGTQTQVFSKKEKKEVFKQIFQAISKRGKLK